MKNITLVATGVVLLVCCGRNSSSFDAKKTTLPPGTQVPSAGASQNGQASNAESQNGATGTASGSASAGAQQSNKSSAGTTPASENKVTNAVNAFKSVFPNLNVAFADDTVSEVSCAAGQYLRGVSKDGKAICETVPKSTMTITEIEEIVKPKLICNTSSSSDFAYGNEVKTVTAKCSAGYIGVSCLFVNNSILSSVAVSSGPTPSCTSPSFYGGSYGSIAINCCRISLD